MSEQQKAELEGKGFIVTQKIHIYIMTAIAIVVFLGGLFASYAVAYSEKETMKNNITNHEDRITTVEENIKTIRDIQLEIKLNLKNQMGHKYQELGVTK